MDLFEYQGKQYFARYDIPVSPGDKADTVDEALAAAELAGYPVVVKAQVQVGGRGKAGGIKLANTPEEVREHVRRNVRAFMPGGGYVFNNVHNVQAGVPPQNIVALFDAAYECGWYA